MFNKCVSVSPVEILCRCVKKKMRVTRANNAVACNASTIHTAGVGEKASSDKKSELVC